MPELPEVETVRRGLAPRIVGRTIEQVRVHQPKLRWPLPPDFGTRLRGHTIRGVGRRAKYLVVQLDDGDRLLLHLGMSGRIFLVPATQAPAKHDHLDLWLSGGVLLRLHDPRRFGAALLWPRSQPQHPLLAHLGPEPFAAEFSGEHLFAQSRRRRAPVKTFLMDQRIVVGVGNIYASEALFRAGIRPQRAAGRVSRAEYARLARAVRAVLARAITAGGTTLRDESFVNADGLPGDFGVRLAVYDRFGRPCPKCRAPIRRQVIGQRSSYWCARCQR